MSNAEIRGRFIWHELMTTDPQSAGAFYSQVLPWKTQPSGMPSYTLWMAGKARAGGLMTQPEDARRAGAVPSWLVYLGTPDVDSTVESAQRLGGKVLKAPDDIPGIGRFAVLSDPQGATFAVFTPTTPPEAATAAASGPGEFSWHELATSDPQAALAFYSELFGWSRGPAHDMGAMGAYQLIEHAGAQVGGMYRLGDTSAAPHWLSYVRVGSVDRAAAAAKAGGGNVTQEPMEVPGGSRVARIRDPQGGAFAVYELPAAAATAAKPTARKTRRPAKTAKASTRPAGKPAAKKVAVSTRPGGRKAARRSPAGSARAASAKTRKRPATAKRATQKATGPARARPAPRKGSRNATVKVVRKVKRKSAKRR